MKEITLINPNDLRTLISEVVQEKLILFSKWFESKLVEAERPLTPKEAREYLSMSKSTFHRYVKDGKIPQYGLGARVYYKQSDLDNQIKRLN